MQKWWCGALMLSTALLMGCDPEEALPEHALSVPSALSASPEQLQLEPASVRSQLFHDLIQSSAAEAGQKAAPGVLFAVSQGQGQDLVAAPALEGHADLLQTWDAGAGVSLELSSSPDPWPGEAQDSLQKLSEREAVALVAAGLLHQWNIDAQGTVRVDRAMGAPYAAAYVDGVLRVNPSFLYLAAAGDSTP